ncbi:MAG: diacylglycerol kinase [Pseudomonadales bacterium]
MNKRSDGIGRRIVNATRYSMQGFSAAWKHEAAFRQETILCVALTPAAFWLGRSIGEVTALLAVMWLVLLTELLNSAVEAAVDRQGEERHPLSGRAKDMGSAAVFVSLSLVVLVWGSVALQRLVGG